MPTRRKACTNTPRFQTHHGASHGSLTKPPSRLVSDLLVVDVVRLISATVYGYAHATPSRKKVGATMAVPQRQRGTKTLALATTQDESHNQQRTALTSYHAVMHPPERAIFVHLKTITVTENG